MKIIPILHKLSYLRWVFILWMIGLMVYIFIWRPENPIQLVGQVIFISGIAMGLASLSDTTRINEKQIKDLSNPKIVNRLFIAFFTVIILLVFISFLFQIQRLVHPEVDKSLLNDFTKLGYDCLVMILGLLCLVKQLADQVKYVNGLDSK
ncbi:MAG: hypothetical protein RBT49_04250 [Bacteroidales bacterium]|nr:hypothetical protein [Bacteroidales bacterium]